MGRWRPPPPKASPYITPAGFAALQRELDALWLRRRDVVAALSAAAAEGDRSENAEYIYRKKELGGIDRRIRYLQKRLPDLTVVRARPRGSAVYFGATVAVTEQGGGDYCYRIVGPDEADAALGDISLDSPLAKALLKKCVGDVVEVSTGERQRTLEVTAVHYGGES